MSPLDSKASVGAIQDTIYDQQGLNSIKSMGRDKNPDALREVAKQFESMFLQQMLKTMRDTNDVFSEGNYFDSNEMKFHRDMMDQQMVLNLSSGKGMGLAEQFYQSMMQAYGQYMNKPEGKDQPVTGDLFNGELPGKVTSRELKMPDVLHYSHINQSLEVDDPASRAMDELMAIYHGEKSVTSESNNSAVPALLRKSEAAGEKLPISQSQQAFVNLLKPHAEKAAKELDVNPDVLIAQVALETGWGKHVIHSQKGENSFNLFNIKAGEKWQGKTVNVSTREYQDGVTYYERADFKRYQNYADSFADYVSLIKNNSRYQQALSAGKDSGAYAQALQKAGYATDPDYADKIKQLLKTDAISAMDDLGQSARSLLGLANQARQQLME